MRPTGQLCNQTCRTSTSPTSAIRWRSSTTCSTGTATDHATSSSTDYGRWHFYRSYRVVGRPRHREAQPGGEAAQRNHCSVLSNRPIWAERPALRVYAPTDPTLVTDFQRYATVPTPAGGSSATWASFSQGVPPDTKKFPNISGLVGVSGAMRRRRIGQHAGGIAYVAYGYAITYDYPSASVVNESGHAVR